MENPFLYNPEQERIDREKAQVENAFSYHAPKSDQPDRYDALRKKAKELAHLILVSCPPSRERSLAMTQLETAVMWANASIARNE